MLTLKGRSTTLSIEFVPLLQLDSNFSYGLALLNFHSYNCIPNIEAGSKLHLATEKNKKTTSYLPEGSYEISDLETNSYKKKVLGVQERNESTFSLKSNTLKCEIFSN